MEDNNRTYGFTISLREYEETIPTLWDATKGKQHGPMYTSSWIDQSESNSEFIQKYPQHYNLDSALKFLSDDGGNTYNMCHCQSRS
jgi:alpha 1,2-mannosyltransferase